MRSSIYLFGIMGDWIFFLFVTLTGGKYEGLDSGNMTYVYYWTSILVLSIFINIYDLSKNKSINRRFITSIYILIIIGCFYLLSFLLFGINDFNLRFAKYFAVVCVSSFLLGMNCAFKKNILKLIKGIIYIILTGTPILLINIYNSLTLSSQKYFMISSGGLDRLGLGYLSAQFFIFTLYITVTKESSIKKLLPRFINSGFGFLTCLILMSIQLITLIISGSRGPLVIVIIVSIVIFVHSIIIRDNYSIIKMMLIMGLFIVAVFYLFTMPNKEFFSAGIDRTFSLFSLGGDDWAGGSGREVLYPIALKLFSASPLLGHGPLGFISDSRTSAYPHNIFLELLTDYGLLGATVWICFFLYIFYKYIRESGNNSVIRFLIIFFFAKFIELNFSSSFLSNAQFFFIIGYGLAIESNNLKQKISLLYKVKVLNVK